VNKHIIRIIFCIIFLVTVIGWYFLPINLNTIVSKQIQPSTVEKANITVFSSAYLQKTYEVNDKAVVDKLTKIFNDIEVRRTVSPPDIFKPSLYNTYYIQLISKDKIVRVDIMDKDYITVNDRTYKIVNEPKLQEIYDIVKAIK